MRKPHSKLGWVASFIAILLLLVGCGGPPKELNEQVKALDAVIETSLTELGTAKSAYEDKIQQESFAFMRDYSPEERHADRFDQAQAKLDEAAKAKDERVKEIADNYSDERKAELETALADVNKLVEEAKALQSEPALWADTLVNAKENTEDTALTAASTATESEAQLAVLKRDTEQAKLSFEAQASAIDRKFQPFNDWQTASASALKTLQSEVERSTPNYATIAENAKTIEDIHASILTEGPKYQATIGELSTSETHTLLDIRVDSEVEISRTSWDNNSDYTTDADYDYPAVPVDAETANYFGAIAPNTLMATDGGFGGFQTEGSIDRAQWDKLGIDPTKDYPSGHNMAEFYMGGVDDTYCHKLLVLRNGEPDTSKRPDPTTDPCSQYSTDAELAKGIYWASAEELQSDAIGMDIYSKGFGDFAEQASTVATPPGMAYVGDPNFGEWNENNGNSFWVFYGQYRLFSDLIGGPNPYHYRSEYNDWNRSYRYQGKPYYSGSSDSPRYGASSPMTAARFPGSTYVKSGLGDATVRNAGPVARGGGPGGGGK